MAKRKHVVEITATAQRDIRYNRDYIAEDNPQAAERWVRKIEQRILKLETFPKRYEVIPEAVEFGVEYRHAIEGNYRIIYRIEGLRVIVIRVFHAARLLDLSMLR
ncbi:MAG TPA: type II toxin-antitoxin system RelE/ParE family toxin [Pirellulaceae bacterium]|nr:type II toxin-antitoxin system RelE/ParE family toxin [Pirellulaceae bacterium]